MLVGVVVNELGIYIYMVINVVSLLGKGSLGGRRVFSYVKGGSTPAAAYLKPEPQTLNRDQGFAEN